MFRSAVVGIAGAGGLGSNVAMLLARSGIGRLILVDDDIVSPSNLNRQFFFMDQIGQPKVTALVANLARLSPFTVTTSHRLRLQAETVPATFADADILVEALDNVQGKMEILSAWTEVFPDRPLILGNGLGGVGDNNAMRTERLFGKVYSCGDGRSDVAEQAPLAPRVTLAAALQANLALELLAVRAGILVESDYGEP